MKHESNMTVKGQVTIPKDIRDALGLRPGQRVRFELDNEGNARIIKFDAEAEKADFRAQVREARRQFAPLADFGGKDGLQYQRWLRGEGPEV